MAGMLPGVEAARRRRIHQSQSMGRLGTMTGCCSHASRRSSFSLFSPSSSASASSLSLQPRSRATSYQYDDDKLGALARDAKDRLDYKLRARAHTTPPLFTRYGNNSESSSDGLQNEEILISRNSERLRNESRREVYGSKKKQGKRLMGWTNLKLGWKWKSGEQQEECAVCLDEYKVGDNLLVLPCAHRFHSTCLLPWIHSNAYCPCCRMSISSS